MAQIILQDTISDFFEAEVGHGLTSSIPRIYVPYRPMLNSDLTIEYLINKKYVMSNWRAPDVSASSLALDQILVPQESSWMAGRMTVFFYEDSRITEKWTGVKDDLSRTLNVLQPCCKLKPVFYTSPQQIRSLSESSLVIPFFPSDMLAQILPHHTQPDLHFELYMKRTLALSGLPTPPAQVIDFGELGADQSDHLVDSAVARVVGIVKARPLPFVLKTNNSSAGRGTFIVATTSAREDVLQAIETNLALDLRKINLNNRSLHPFSLVITDLIPGDTQSINFYVKFNGKAQISSICEQWLSDDCFWIGAAITYSAQPHLTASINEVTQKTAEFLHLRGYHGPAGIDVMTDENGQHLVVDINVRPTASFVLGCLHRHFVDTLSFDAACILSPLSFSGSRDQFSAAFQRELDVGEVVVYAWVADPSELRSHFALIVGGRTASKVQELCERLKTWIRCNGH